MPGFLLVLWQGNKGSNRGRLPGLSLDPPIHSHQADVRLVAIIGWPGGLLGPLVGNTSSFFRKG
jgi:hypothetical protein